MSSSIKNNSQIYDGIRSRIPVDPHPKKPKPAEKRVEMPPIQDQTTVESVRIGASLAPTVEQAMDANAGVLQARVTATSTHKKRSRGRRTGALREPNAVQLFRSMKNPEAMKTVLALQTALQRVLAE